MISTTKLGEWIDDRSALLSGARKFMSYRAPAHAQRNIMIWLGSLTLVSLITQALTGILLVFYYDPSTEGAYNSVDYITYQLPLGWLIRGLHHYGASAVVVLTVLHMLRTYFSSAYKKPREINWLSGVVLLLLVLSFGFTGYLLPWDQKGYWATRVGTEIAGSVPGIGDLLAQLMRGGAVQGQTTLTRFFAVHILILPVTVALFLAVHLSQLRRHGLAPAATAAADSPVIRSDRPFFPYGMLKIAAAALLVLGILLYLSATVGAPLEFPADPTNSNYVPRPEWYFLFFYQLLRYFPGAFEPVATVLIPAFIFGCMFLLPFTDRSAVRHPLKKPVTLIAGLFYIAAVIVLTVLALIS